MDEERPIKRQAPRSSRVARNKRIVERLRDGFACSEIAREEKLTERRVRQIVKEALQSREALEKALHAHMQFERVARAMRAGGEALARGDVRAMAPFLKAVEKLDHYQALAREAAPRPEKKVSADDSLVVSEIIRRIRRDVLAECRAEAAAEFAAKAAAQSGDVQVAAASQTGEATVAAAPAAPSDEPPAPVAPLELPPTESSLSP